MLIHILLAILVPAAIIVAWFIIWSMIFDGDPPLPLVIISFALLVILWLCISPFWFWTSVATMTLLLVCLAPPIMILLLECLAHPIWLAFAGASVWLTIGCVMEMLNPGFSPGPQWVETKGGTMVWVDCPSVATNAIWSGRSKANVASGPGDLAVCFEDGSVLRTNLVLRWGFPENIESFPVKNAGWSFFGTVRNGKPRGFGVLRDKDHFFVGTFRSNGSAKGNVLEFDAGGHMVYSGGFSHYQYNGEGALHFPDGASYNGGFKNGRYHGFGRERLSDGSQYEGGFKKGRYHGFGRKRFSDGRRYEGDFMDGVRQGYGREWFPDGSRFKGYFENDMRNGRGASTDASGVRTWHVWSNDKISDREVILRRRLDNAASNISPKTKQRFERYLCFYELNGWWMTTLLALAFASFFVFGNLHGPSIPDLFAEKPMKEVDVRRTFWHGAIFGWHKIQTDRPGAMAYPFLLFLSAVFASKTLLLFLPFPGLWLSMPTCPIAALACLAVFVGLCIYDLLFGIGYDTYRFNWKWFWNPAYDEKLRTGDDVEFTISNLLREDTKMIRKDAEAAKREAQTIFKQLHAKHKNDDEQLGFWAAWKEAFGKYEEKQTRELVEIAKTVKQLAEQISTEARVASDALNWFHFVFQRARNLSYEVLDESMAKPALRKQYEREFDKIDNVMVSIVPVEAENRISAHSEMMIPFFGEVWAGFSDSWNLITGNETQLSKLRKDQKAAYDIIIEAVPRIGNSYAQIREAADRLDEIGTVIQLFHKHYGNVREKLLGSPSINDYWRRRHGYRGREALLSDDELKSEFAPMLQFLIELTGRFKKLDELKRLGDTPNNN